MNGRYDFRKSQRRLFSALLCLFISAAMVFSGMVPSLTAFAEDDKVQSVAAQAATDSNAGAEAENENTNEVNSENEGSEDSKGSNGTEDESKPDVASDVEEAGKGSDVSDADKDGGAGVAQTSGAASGGFEETTASEKAFGAAAANGAEAIDDAAADAAETEAEEEEIADPAAVIKDKKFESLKAAVEAASDGDVIVLQKDIKEKIAVSGKAIKIDLNGHVWTAKGGSNRQFIRMSEGADVTIMNGTLTGGKAKPEEEAALYNNGGRLAVKDIKLSGGAGEQIRNIGGTLIVENSVFTGVKTMPGDWSRYIIYNDGANATASVSGSVFKDNNMAAGGIICAYGSYRASSANNDLTLTSCDIKDNTVSNASVYCRSNVSLHIHDTTISGNTVDSNYSDTTGGLYMWEGQIDWKDSAIYNNSAASSSHFARDMYIRIEELLGGEVPLPEDMKDHGSPLSGYKMCDGRYSYVFTEPLTKNTFKNYSEIAIEPIEDDDSIAEYDGKTYALISDAVKAMDGKAGTVKILKDAKVGDTFTGHEGLVIDLDGHSLSAASSSMPVLTVRGGEATVMNGSLIDGKASAVSAIEATDAALTLKSLEVKNHKGDAVSVRYSTMTEAALRKVEVSGCRFYSNGSNENDYAINAADCDLYVDNCVFDGNTGGLRMYNFGVEGKPVEVKVSNSKFINGSDCQIESYLEKNSSAVFSDCVISDNKAENSDSIICLQQKTYGEPREGGSQSFVNCVIKDNSGADEATISAETGDISFTDCVISGNSARRVGAIEAEPFAYLHLKDTVVKNNKNTGKSGVTSGGIALRSANFIIVTPGVGSSSGSSTEHGFFTSSLEMTGGALYGNENAAASPSAEDLYVAKSCEIRVPEISDMKDGDYNFTGLFWKDDNAKDVEYTPTEKVAAVRYYSVGVPSGIKQVYVDGVNGDDSNIGTKDEPVKTIETAGLLAERYKSRNILVLDTVTVLPSENKTLSFEGVTIKRDPSFTGILIEIAEGADITLKDAVIDGSSGSWVKGLGSLIKVNEGARLTLDSGVQLQNNGYNMNRGNDKGGAVHCLGDLVMNDGAVVSHNYAVTGGGICVDGGTFIMNGGLIDDNTALYRLFGSENGDYSDSYGGGVALIRGAYMEMKGGTISNNEALLGGGGVSLGTSNTKTVKDGGTVTFVMRGGSIESNEGYASGGGIYVQCSTEAYISAGNISSNKAKNSMGREGHTAHFSGGGIYVNGYHNSLENMSGIVHGKLYMSNVEIADNVAEWTGGAIAVCGSGHGSFADVKGTVIHDNYAKGKGAILHRMEVGYDGYDGDYDLFFDDIEYIYDYSAGKWEKPAASETLAYESYVSDLMINGGEYNWTDEDGEAISLENLHKVNKKLLANTDVTASDPDVKASVAKARVHINGNTAGSNGGGIGCNGELHIGQLPDYIDIPVEKKWDDAGHEGKRPESIKVNLYTDGELSDSAIISADENGEWKAVFEDLPEYKLSKNGEQTKEKYEYTIEEEISYVPAGYGKPISDAYTSQTATAEDGSCIITNTVIPEIPEEVKEEHNPPEEVKEVYVPPEEVKEVYVPPKEIKEKGEVRGVYENTQKKKSAVKGASSGVNTGDANGISVYITVIALAAAAFSVLIIRKRRGKTG